MTLTNAAWWRNALLRAVYTAIVLVVPYLAGGATIRNIDWLMLGSVAAMGVITSFATSLAGLPEAVGVYLPWWLTALERVGKTFAQALLSGLVGATLLSQVSWSHVLQASALAAFLTLLRLILSTLPADPTAASAGLPVVVPPVPEVDPAEPDNGDPLPDAQTVTS